MARGEKDEQILYDGMIGWRNRYFSSEIFFYSSSHDGFMVRERERNFWEDCDW